LLRLGRQVGDPTLLPADPTLTQVRERLHEAKSATRATSVEPADLFFLRPADRPDVLGMLGHYEVSEVIGQGGMGIVLKAFDPGLHRLVAIKVLAPAIAGSATARKRFTREAQAAAAVCHDHVVTVHGVLEADGLPYLVMQYIPGESLQTRLDRVGPLELMEIVRIGLQAALGLGAAHAQGLIHRDIKPANLLLENGLARVKITDFGLARMADDVALTQNGVVAGTPEYMAPEQARGEPVDHRADLFSLGSVLYTMCTGVPPFRGPSTVAVLRKVSDQEPTPIRDLNPEIPEWLAKLVQRLMARDPARRFQSSAEVAALLESYLAHLRQPRTISAPNLPSSPIDIDRRQRTVRGEHRFLRLTTVVTGLASAVVLAWFALSFLLAGKNPERQQGSRQPEEFYLSLKGSMDDNPGIELAGPDAADCVKFEPGGLRITLPRGWDGVRSNTGVRLPIAIRGDCTITVHYEILFEQNGGGVNAQSTRITLGTGLEKEGLTVGTLSRRSDAKPGAGFLAWMMFPNEATGRRQYRSKGFPAKSKDGQLRLSRTGSILSYLVSEGEDKEFTLLHQFPFGSEDLNHIHIAGSTPNANSSLEVRLTDLHIRADALLAHPSPAEGTILSANRARGWMTATGIIGLVLTLSLSVVLWFAARRQRRAAADGKDYRLGMESPVHSLTADFFSLSCSECGKTLKARHELAGKKVKCPQCGKSVSVPAGGSRQSDSPVK
jgi:serine/threonine protein kinase